MAVSVGDIVYYRNYKFNFQTRRHDIVAMTKCEILGFSKTGNKVKIRTKECLATGAYPGVVKTVFGDSLYYKDGTKVKTPFDEAKEIEAENAKWEMLKNIYGEDPYFQR